MSKPNEVELRVRALFDTAIGAAEIASKGNRPVEVVQQLEVMIKCHEFSMRAAVMAAHINKEFGDGA